VSDVVFFTFWTDDNYRKAAERLRVSCDRWGIKTDFREASDQGSWRHNCNQKPRLLWALRQEYTCPIVCLDADCVVHARPDLLMEPHDCDAILWNGGVPSRARRGYVSSGVTWWNNTTRARRMLKHWAKLSKLRLNKIVDPLLRVVCLEAMQHGARIETLPSAYMKPYWIRKRGLSANGIVISCNERPGTHTDGLYGRKRLRLDPLTPEHAL